MLKRGLAAAFAVLSAVVTGGTALAQSTTPSPTLDAIRARGQLICGINTGVAGISQPDSRGVWQALDVEMCRAQAVAIGTGPRYALCSIGTNPY